MFFSLLLTFYYLIDFQCIYEIIIISIKNFLDIKFCVKLVLLYWRWREPNGFCQVDLSIYEPSLL